MARHTSQPQSLLVGGRPAMPREVLVEGPWAWVLSVTGCAILGQLLPLSGLLFPPRTQDVSDSSSELEQGGPGGGLTSE